MDSGSIATFGSNLGVDGFVLLADPFSDSIRDTVESPGWHLGNLLSRREPSHGYHECFRHPVVTQPLAHKPLSHQSQSLQDFHTNRENSKPPRLSPYSALLPALPQKLLLPL